MEKNLTFEELKALMIQRYDGNAGEIINGFLEMGLTGQRLRLAMQQYINQVPAYKK